jgi:preprotein translocase subunit SecE
MTNPLSALGTYLSASRVELTKVTWPNRRQTIQLTIAVIIFSLLMAAFLGAVDLGFQYLVKKLILKS